MGPRLQFVARAFREQQAFAGVEKQPFAWAHILLLTVLENCQWTTSGIKRAPEETREPHLVPPRAATAVGATTSRVGSAGSTASRAGTTTHSAASAGSTASRVGSHRQFQLDRRQGGTTRVGSREA